MAKPRKSTPRCSNERREFCTWPSCFYYWPPHNAFLADGLFLIHQKHSITKWSNNSSHTVLALILSSPAPLSPWLHCPLVCKCAITHFPKTFKLPLKWPRELEHLLVVSGGRNSGRYTLFKSRSCLYIIVCLWFSLRALENLEIDSWWTSFLRILHSSNTKWN